MRTHGKKYTAAKGQVENKPYALADALPLGQGLAPAVATGLGALDRALRERLMTETRQILTERGVTTIVLDHPANRNALSTAMIGAVAEAVRDKITSNMSERAATTLERVGSKTLT